MYDATCIERVRAIAAEPFGRCRYRHAGFVVNAKRSGTRATEGTARAHTHTWGREADTLVRCNSYTEAVNILQKAIADGVKFENNDVEWGMDFGSEHERYLAEKVLSLSVC